MLENKMNSRMIGQRQCYIKQYGAGGPAVLWGMYPHQGNEIEHMEECLSNLGKTKDFLLVAYQVKDWNRDCSPWSAPNIWPGEPDFEGGGPDTLNWLEKELVPELKNRYVTEHFYLAGYSLAGFFSLWAMYESEAFEAAACCSGSLWYEGWDDYVQTHGVRRNCRIYMSLGGKEEKTKNPVMATVGDKTRRQEKILKADPNVAECILEWNSGGHFADSGKRLEKGIRWMLENAE